MQIENIDMAFITGTWIKKEDLQLITPQLKCFGYNIITENRMTRKGGGLACIYKDDLTVEKNKNRQKSHIWTSIIKNKDSITQTAFGIDL